MSPLIKTKEVTQKRKLIVDQSTDLLKGKKLKNQSKGLIEDKFDVSFIAKLALKEKQIQQFVRPIIAVHKWFARRPGTLFRALALSEFSNKSLSESFYSSNDFPNKKVLDPFMGGGTPILEANRIGCDVYGYDLNPMAAWIVSREIEDLNLSLYMSNVKDLIEHLEKEFGHLYETQCLSCNNKQAKVKYFIWARTHDCGECKTTNLLLPGNLIAENKRHNTNVVFCLVCENLNECDNIENLGKCRSCKAKLSLEGSISKSRYSCKNCQSINKVPDKKITGFQMIAIEYWCPKCEKGHTGRFFKTPDKRDLECTQKAKLALKKANHKFLPDDPIPEGDETTRLLKWGYKYFHELFNERQKLLLLLTAEKISQMKNSPIKDAIATNFSDLLRYQNMLCRYDAMALKSLDIFSVHGFPVGFMACESNFFGLRRGENTPLIGSGGLRNITEKYRKAKVYCHEPFELKYKDGKKISVKIEGEEIGKNESKRKNNPKIIHINCGDSSRAQIAPGSIDLVLTDPPYYGNVQYAELMDFCFVWLRKLLQGRMPYFNTEKSTRNSEELTVNDTQGRGAKHFSEGLARTFGVVKKALKKDAGLVFTYHHNEALAYAPLAFSFLENDLDCSEIFPCPGEMGGSIHISGTASSVLDSVFVLRNRTPNYGKWTITFAKKHLEKDIENLKNGEVAPTLGDKKCLSLGLGVFVAVEKHRRTWKNDRLKPEIMKELTASIEDFASNILGKGEEK